MTCAALFPGVALADLDRHRIYEVPAAMVQTISLPQQLVAKACARRHGLRWRIVSK